MFSWFLQLPFLLWTNLAAKVMNSIAKLMNSIANEMNSVAKPTNSIANRTNSIAKVTNSIANKTNSIAKSPNSIAKTCNKAFTTVFTREDNYACTDSTPYPEISPIGISTEGVAHLLGNLDTSKTIGPDKVPTKFLKELAFQLGPILSVIYKASLEQG